MMNYRNPKFLHRLKVLFVIVALCQLLLGGCATSKLHEARALYGAGNSQAALEILSDESIVKSRNKLLFWLEKGLILHETGDYEASNQALLAAADFLDETDVVSVSGEVKSLVANDWARHYRGEYSEQLWIHSYLMMNFLALGQYESAAVEARRALEKIASREQLLSADYFTRAVIGVSFAAAGNLNSAYIENRKLAESLSDGAAHPVLMDTLLAQANRLGFTNAARQYQQLLGDTAAATASREVVIFLASGQIPYKISGSLITSFDQATRIAFPEYLGGFHGEAASIAVKVDGEVCDCARLSSSLVALAQAALAARGAGLAARAAVRVVAKDALADSIAKHDETAGEIARLLLFVLEEADVRGWHSLPGQIALLRVPLADGASQVTIEDNRGAVLRQLDVSTLQPRQRRYIPLRVR